MARLSDLLRSPFSFLFTGTQREDRVTAYILREHDRGRPLAEILDDAYVRNRCTREQTARLLERPDVIRALGHDVVESAKQALPTG